MSGLRCRSSQRGSLPLALLVAIIVAGVVVVLIARTVTSQRQVQFDQSFHGALPAADAGLEQAKFWLNSGQDLESESGKIKGPRDFASDESTAPQPGELDGRTYEWVLTRRSGYWEASSRAVDARGRTEVDRHLVAEYREQPLVSNAAFADDQFLLHGGNTADSYNSSTGEWCTKKGFVGSNGPVLFTGTAAPGPCASIRPTGRTVDRVLLYDWPEDEANLPDGITTELPGGERCGREQGNSVQPDTTNCKFASEGGDEDEYDAPATIPGKITPSIEGASAFIDAALQKCVDDGIALNDFRSTINGATLSPADEGDGWPEFKDIDSVDFDLGGHYYCYDDLYFDAHTTLAGAGINNPVIIFVNGNVTMARGNNSNQNVYVGCGSGGCTPGVSTPEAGRLWIFVKGGEVGIRAQSDFAGVLWAPESVCGSTGPGQGGGSNAQADFYGSLICGSIANGNGGWRFHYDEDLGQIGDGQWFQDGWSEVEGPPSS